MEYEYKKVEGVSVGQVVDSMLAGDDFYFYQGLDSYHPLTFEVMNFNLGVENIYTRTEKPWWVGCEGMPVMTCLGMAILDKYVDGKTPFYTNLGRFNNARLLTSAERDAIKVRG